MKRTKGIRRALLGEDVLEVVFDFRTGVRISGSLGYSVMTKMLSAMTISGQKFDNIFTKNKQTDPTFF